MDKLKATIHLSKMELVKVIDNFETKYTNGLKQRVEKGSAMSLNSNQQQQLDQIKRELESHEDLLHKTRSMILYHGAIIACVTTYIKEMEEKILEGGKLELPLMQTQADMFNDLWPSIKLVDNLYNENTTLEKVSELMKRFDAVPESISKTS